MHEEIYLHRNWQAWSHAFRAATEGLQRRRHVFPPPQTLSRSRERMFLVPLVGKDKEMRASRPPSRLGWRRERMCLPSAPLLRMQERVFSTGPRWGEGLQTSLPSRRCFTGDGGVSRPFRKRAGFVNGGHGDRAPPNGGSLFPATAERAHGGCEARPGGPRPTLPADGTTGAGRYGEGRKKNSRRAPGGSFF
jgi:hypothetical protein